MIQQTRDRRLGALGTVLRRAVEGKRRYDEQAPIAVALFPKLALMGLGRRLWESGGITSCVCSRLALCEHEMQRTSRCFVTYNRL